MLDLDETLRKFSTLLTIDNKPQNHLGESLPNLFHLFHHLFHISIEKSG